MIFEDYDIETKVLANSARTHYVIVSTIIDDTTYKMSFRTTWQMDLNGNMSTVLVSEKLDTRQMDRPVNGARLLNGEEMRELMQIALDEINQLHPELKVQGISSLFSVVRP